MKRAFLSALDAVTYLWCAVAVVVLIWQSAALARGITFGPGEPLLLAPLTRVFYTCVVVLCTAAAATRIAGRLSGTTGRIDQAVVVQVTLGLCAMALSYRLVAFLLFVLAIGCRLINPARLRVAAWFIWGLALISSLAPVDVTLRSSAHEPRLVPATNCEDANDEMVRAIDNGELVCVANGPYLYYPPRWAVIW